MPGQKIEALRSNPRACRQVDEIVSEAEWQSVLAYGFYEEIEDYDKRAEILQSFYQRFAMLIPVESTIIQDATVLLVMCFDSESTACLVYVKDDRCLDLNRRLSHAVMLPCDDPVLC